MARHEVRATGMFGSSFGCIMGIATALIVLGIVGALMCAGVIGGCGVATKTVIDEAEKRRIEQEKKEADRAAKETRALAMKEYSKTGYVRAFVRDVAIQPVKVIDFGETKESNESYLVVTVELQMLDDQKRWEFAGWSSTKKLLSDPIGNSYERPTFGFGTKVVGELAPERIVTGKPAKGILVFDAPPPGITELNLDLPATGMDGDGYFRFKIPASLWKK